MDGVRKFNAIVFPIGHEDGMPHASVNGAECADVTIGLNADNTADGAVFLATLKIVNSECALKVFLEEVVVAETGAEFDGRFPDVRQTATRLPPRRGLPQKNE